MKGFLRGLTGGLFGHAALPLDEEFEGKLRGFNDHVERLRKVRVALQLYSDAVDALSKAEMVVADAFDSYYAHSIPQTGAAGGGLAGAPAAHGVTDSFKTLMAEKFTIVRSAINGILQNRCIKPVTAILAKVGPLQEKVKQRRSLLQDHEAHRSMIQKEQESGKSNDDANIQRHSIKLDQMSLSLGQLVSSVDGALLEFEKARPHMLVQELAAVLGVCYYNGTATAALLGRLLPLLPQTASTLCLLNALGSKKLRPSHLSTDNLQRVEPSVARTSIMGGRYGGYGLLGADMLQVPAPPLQSREALAQRRAAHNAQLAAAAAPTIVSSVALELPVMSNAASTPLEQMSPTGRNALPTRTPSFRMSSAAATPTIVSSSSSVLTAVDGEASSDEEEDLLGALSTALSTQAKQQGSSDLLDQHWSVGLESSAAGAETAMGAKSDVGGDLGQSPDLNKRSSLAVLKSKGIVKSALQTTAARGLEPPPKPPKSTGAPPS